jgi:hypothetical protein
VPVTLFTHPPTNHESGPSETDLNASIALITDQALALPDIAATTITMHRLTQRVIRDDLSASGGLTEVAARAATLIEAAIPSDPTRRDAWPLCSVLLPHALAVLDPVGPPLRRLAQYPGSAGDYPTAVLVWATLTSAHIQTRGPEHPDTLAARSNLARWTGQAGDAEAARDQYVDLLPVLERVLGPEHPDTVATRANLALWMGRAEGFVTPPRRSAGRSPQRHGGRRHTH